MKKQFGIVVLALALVLGGVVSVSAQDTPSVEVADQLSLDGTVTIASAYSEGPGFIVIHIDNGEGAPGPIAGYRAINPGWNYNVKVEIDTTMATPTLFAMLHKDDNTVGEYEFGQVEGADGPVVVDGSVVTPPFNVNIVYATDQFVEMGHITIASVTAQVPGWLVVHALNPEGFRPGPVLGETWVDAGTTVDVQVDLEGEITDVLWPMLHVDTGEAGVYEFGSVEGADVPVVVDGRVATFPIWTVPHMRVSDQPIMHGENRPDGGGMMTPTLVADSALSEGPGWLVVHADNDGAPGPVLGFSPVEAGLNTDVAVELDADGLTPTLWPMLHVDTGEAGVYEFGQVEGADGPVRVNDAVLTFPINAAPAIVYEGSIDEMGTLTVAEAVIDAPGWLVIHANADGAPGPVLGATPLLHGVNTNVAVQVDPDAAGDQVFPMLHYDTGEAGVYEFGQVEGADPPVFLGGAPVVGPMSLGE